jgi:hypothetical protein
MQSSEAEANVCLNIACHIWRPAISLGQPANFLFGQFLEILGKFLRMQDLLMSHLPPAFCDKL